MRTVRGIVAVAMGIVLMTGVGHLAGQSVEILSLSNDGTLTWTNAYPKQAYTVEWSPMPGDGGDWSASWEDLRRTPPSLVPICTARVPLFYRVRVAEDPLQVTGTWDLVGTYAGSFTMTMTQSGTALSPFTFTGAVAWLQEGQVILSWIFDDHIIFVIGDYHNDAMMKYEGTVTGPDTMAGECIEYESGTWWEANSGTWTATRR